MSTLTGSDVFQIWSESFRRLASAEGYSAAGIELFLKNNRDKMLVVHEKVAQKVNEMRAASVETALVQTQEAVEERMLEAEAREAELREREAEVRVKEAEVAAQAAEVRAAEVEVAAQAQAVEIQAEQAGVEVPPPAAVIDPAEQERIDDERYMAQFKAAITRVEAAMDADSNLTLEQAIDKHAFPAELKEALRRRLQSGPWGEHYRNVARACIGEGMPRGGARRFQHPGRSEACPSPRRLERTERMPSSYNWVTSDMFDAKLHDIVDRDAAHDLLTIPGVYEAVKEDFNNEVLQELVDDGYKRRQITDAIFDEKLEEIVDRGTASALLSISGVYEPVSEHFNNEILRELSDERRRGRRKPRASEAMPRYHR